MRAAGASSRPSPEATEGREEPRNARKGTALGVAAAARPRLRRDQRRDRATMNAVMKEMPLGRLGRVEEIACAVLAPVSCLGTCWWWMAATSRADELMN